MDACGYWAWALVCLPWHKNLRARLVEVEARACFVWVFNASILSYSLLLVW